MSNPFRFTQIVPVTVAQHSVLASCIGMFGDTLAEWLAARDKTESCATVTGTLFGE